MERGGAALAQELRRWAAEEMRLPLGKIPSESAARRMCSGQCAEIWEYVIRHVRHQRNVKKIRGNLLWYQQIEETEGKSSSTDLEKEYRKQLVQSITRLRGEVEQIDLQIGSAQRELTADEVALEVAQEKIRDAKHRTLLLKAYLARVTAERQQLRSQVVQVTGRVKQLQEVERKARTAVAFGSGRAPEAGFPSLEPEVLRDVREACRLRFRFLKTLFEHSVTGNFPSRTSEEQLSMSYQHWLTVAEKVAGSHPPAHILSALEHLALENTRQLQELTDSINISQDVKALKFRYASPHLEDVSEAADDLPSIQGLIQEGWSECEMLCVQQLPLRAKAKQLSAQLEAVVREMHCQLSDGSEHAILARAVFELELRAVKLRAFRDGLLSGCRELEETVKTRYEELQGLQTKRQRILDFRHLVSKKQEQIRTLIKGTSYIKSQLRKDQAEIQDFLEKKLLPQEQQLVLGAQKLHNRIDQEVQQFRGIALPCLLRRDLPGPQCVPAHELSIHRLNQTAPAEYRAFFNVCNGTAFPLYKAPEQLLSHVAEMKKALFALRAQLGLKQRAVGNLQRQRDNTLEPSVQALMQEVRAHDREQAGELLPRILRVTDQCKRRIERWPEVQAVVDAWWEQPGQFVLPGEQRFGFTLQQWLQRWTLASKTVQQKQPQHSWV